MRCRCWKTSRMERQALVPEMEQLPRPMDAAPIRRMAAWPHGLADGRCLHAIPAPPRLAQLHRRHVGDGVHAHPVLAVATRGRLAGADVCGLRPSIHYQIQMHSSMAASPVLRLYNPVTQARELDPQGHFVRCWVPELAAVPDEWIAMPWAMPATLRHRFGLVGAADYPCALGRLRASPPLRQG